jgi:hypothetical protein
MRDSGGWIFRMLFQALCSAVRVDASEFDIKKKWLSSLSVDKHVNEGSATVSLSILRGKLEDMASPMVTLPFCRFLRLPGSSLPNNTLSLYAAIRQSRCIKSRSANRLVCLPTDSNAGCRVMSPSAFIAICASSTKACESRSHFGACFKPG